MNDSPINPIKRNRAIQLYAILSLLSIGLLVHGIAEGNFSVQINKARSLAQTVSGVVLQNGGSYYSTSSASGTTSYYNTTPVPFSLDASYSTDTSIYPTVFSGGAAATKVSGKIMLKVEAPSDNVVFVYGAPDNSTTQTVVTTSNGLRRVPGSNIWQYELDTTTLKNTYFYFRAAYYTPNRLWLYTNKVPFYVSNEALVPVTSTTTPGTTSTSTLGGIATNTPTSVIETTFYPAKSYTQDLKIFPTILKDNIRIDSPISGTVSFHVEAGYDKVLLLIGTRSEWMSSGIINQSNGLIRVPDTSRWTYNFDSKKLSDGYYKVGAAYFNPNIGWVTTGSLEFYIKNIVETPTLASTTIVQKPILVTTVTHEETVIAPPPASNQPVEQKPVVTETVVTPPPVVTTVIAPQPVVEIFKPVLRLVVNDRQVIDLKHTFDSEELELRVTTNPAIAVKFFAFSLDGAFKPAIKELGLGGKDDLLSRDGKEVWTYTTDMRDFPTGNYRLYARVDSKDGTRPESQYISIIVQHLMQMGVAPTVATETPAVISVETRQSILERVTDPSACQNRQECEVFCSSNNSAQSKCLSFVRVSDNIIASSSVIENKQNQENTLVKITSLLPELNKRFSDIRATDQIDASSSELVINTETQSSSTDIVDLSVPVSSGRASVMDIIPTSIIEEIISVKDKMDFVLPDEIKTVSHLQQYCGVVEHESDCSNSIAKIVPELKDNVEKQAEVVRNEESRTLQLLDQRSGARTFVDSDSDGVTDFDEINFYRTDPAKRDTNNDGYSDGAAILGQMSPTVLGASTSDSNGKIVLAQGVSVENPKITGSTQEKQFSVTSITPIGFVENDEGKKDISKVAFKGVALPNSFVKIFLFSDPIVVTVKTDDSGNWSYVLDKTLPDGTHTAYVAMADGGGRILAKSAPLPFVKEASAITVNSVGGNGIIESSNTIMGLSPITLIALFVGILGVALSIVGIVIGYKFHGQNKLDGTPSV